MSDREVPSLLALDHVQLAMPSGGETAAEGFYAGVLGMQRIEKPEPMRASGGVWYRSGAAELHLGVEADFRPARKAHPALRASNLSAMAARCEAAGLPVVWDDRYPGMRRFYVNDPFGNRIEILQAEPETAPKPLSSRGPAYRVVTDRLAIRCWNPGDAGLLKDAVDRSLEHLRPWLPWAHHEPEELDAKIDRLRRFRGDFDLGKDFVYGIFDPEERVVLGGTGLHTRAGEGAREIGYWIRVEQVGRGLAGEAAGALTRVAFEVDGVERVEIRCDPQNLASAAIPHRLGFELREVRHGDVSDSDGHPRDTMIWLMERCAYETSSVRSLRIEAFDVVGRSLLLAGDQQSNP